MNSKLTIGVAGSGTMGTGIAIVAARAGFPTILYDVDLARLENAKSQATAFLGKSVAKGKLSQEQADAIVGRLKVTTEPAEMGACGLVVEAIFEDIKAKAGLYQTLDKVCASETIFASNTSTLSITELAAASRRADRFVGMHFCLPAQLMKLVEMSAGLNTDPAVFDQAWQIALDMGQKPVRTQDAPGFILNCFLVPFNNDAIRLVEQGVAAPADIDLAIKEGLGYAMGPMELLDLIGMDTQVLLCEALHGVTGEKRAWCPPLVRRMVAAGHLGRKSGRGFHTYDSTRIFGG